VASINDDLGGILKIIKDLEHQGYEFEAAEASLGLLIMRALRKEDPPFKVDAYHVSMRGDHRESVCEATIKVRVGDKVAHTVADGDGPVNALDGALRLGLVNFYPELNALRLTDYKVRILDSSTGTASMTRVLIESTDGKKTWSTVGVSGNIVEASLKALSDSLEYWLLRYAVKDLTATS
jgi:2-isopropylmalate synthase